MVVGIVWYGMVEVCCEAFRFAECQGQNRMRMPEYYVICLRHGRRQFEARPHAWPILFASSTVIVCTYVVLVCRCWDFVLYVFNLDTSFYFIDLL